MSYINHNDDELFLPSQKGYLKLCSEYEPLIDEVLKKFNIRYTRESFWLHLNQKLFGSLYPQDLDNVNPCSVVDFLYTALRCGLNPLSGDIASTYDYFSKNIKPVILMDGFIRMYNSDPNADGFKFNNIGSRKVNLTFHRTVTENGKKKTVYEQREEIIPESVECHLYIKGKSHPYTGICDALEIGNTNAWQEHTIQMMRNRAFTRAARMLYNTSAMSAYDAYEFNELQELQGADREEFNNTAPRKEKSNENFVKKGNIAQPVKTISEEEFMTLAQNQNSGDKKPILATKTPETITPANDHVQEKVHEDIAQLDVNTLRFHSDANVSKSIVVDRSSLSEIDDEDFILKVRKKA